MNNETSIDVVVWRGEIGALAARTGVPVVRLLALIERQHRGQAVKPRLMVDLRNDGPAFEAVKRACCGGSADEA